MTSAAEVVVVGVDGSPDAEAALRWAATLVGSHGRVHAVHALGDHLYGGCAHQQRSAASQQLREWCSALGPAGASVEQHVEDGPCVEALARVARDGGAKMIVVGGRGRSRRRPCTIGSVSHRLLRESHLPVVVVRHGHASAFADDANVVVGIGDGDATRAAVGWAATFARERNMKLELVHALGHRTICGLLTPAFSMEGALEKAARYFDPGTLRLWADDDLAKRVNQLHGQRGMESLPVSHSVAEGEPGPSLVESGHHAALLVTGKHFDGPLTGYLTTAALQHVLTHAPCPVVVVPKEFGQD